MCLRPQIIIPKAMSYLWVENRQTTHLSERGGGGGGGGGGGERVRVCVRGG